MRVALSIEKFHPALGGGERYAYNFACRLRDAGHEVHVYTPPCDMPDEGFRYHWVEVGRHFPRWEFARKAATRLREADFDIVHGFGKSVYMDVFRPGGGVHRAWQDHELRMLDGRRARWRRRIQQLGSLNQQLVLWLERQQFGPGGRHLIIVNSEMVKREIQRYYGCEADRIRIVPNGADLARFTPEVRERHRAATRERLGLAPDELVILFLGHNFQRKGLVPLARALPALARRLDRRFRLLVVGDGEVAPAMAIAGDAGLADRILDAGPAADPAPYYAAADVFCLPSYYDPCANVVLEALAMSLPVVTSTTNGCGELLTPGREGYQVDLQDSEALAARLAEYGDDVMRERAARAARALAEKRPLERDYQAIVAVYEEALARKGRT